MNEHLANEMPGYQSVVDVLESRASDRPLARVFTFQTFSGGAGGAPEVSLTLAALARGARALGARLQEHGLEGERAVLLYPPGLDFITAFFGCLAAGVVAVPTPAPRPNRPPERLRTILADAQPRAILTTGSLAAERARWSDAIPELDDLIWLPTDRADGSPGEDEHEHALAARWRNPGLSHATLAFLQYTSGSTAAPRGVMITHGNLLHNSAQIQRSFGSTYESRGVFWLPLFHDMGLIGGVLQTIYCGGTSTLFSPVAFLQDPYRWLETISRTRATISGGPNFAYDLCARKLSAEQRATLDLSSWSVAFNGAEPVRAETLDRFAELFAPCGFRREAFLPCYGLAEATLIVSGRTEPVPPVVLAAEAAGLEQNRVCPALVGSEIRDLRGARGDNRDTRTLVGSGRVCAGQEVVIVDPVTGNRCGGDAVGEIWVAGANVALGYWNQPEASAATFQAEHAGRRFLRTGDLGFLRDGELFVTGRLKDLMIIGGRNVYPQEIEETVARSHPLLRADSGAAFAVEHEGQERLVVVHEVERQARADRVEEIAGRIRQALAEEHELEPQAVVLIKAATIPKTSSGKIRRHACREAYLAAELDVVGTSVRNASPAVHGSAGASPSHATGSSDQAAELEAWLVARLAASLEVEPSAIDRRRPFAQLGLGSIRAVGLAGELQDHLGRPLSPTVFYEYPTIADLSAFLAGHGAAVPAALAASAEGAALASSAPIAITGIGCRFPGADGPEAFWALLSAGRDAIGEVSAERRQRGGLSAGTLGGFLERIDAFDADFFGLSPREAAPLDPQQRLVLEVAWEALEDAGIAPERLAGSATGVFLGIATNDYGRLGGGDDQPGDVYRITGNALSIAANRVSYLFDLRGPSVAIDTACSSSLVAVHLACQSLRSGESTLALAGGVNLILAPAIAASFRQAGMLAVDGRCKTFDARADGYVRSEGAGVVVLKPLARALADGDPVYAVIRGSAANQDGKSNGLTAPSRQSQEAVVRAACRQAGIAPGRIGYVEAHGTGTYLGDPIELKALGSVLAEGRPPGRRTLVGSVKTNIGHLEAAAGVAGLIKTALALWHRAIPPHLHFHEPNPEIPFAELPLAVPTRRVPWPEEGPAFAGVSSFGFGGTNAHVVLEGVGEPSLTRPSASSGDGAMAYLLPISARRPEALRALAHAYREALAEGLTGCDLGSIAWSAAARRGHHEYRLAVIGRSRAEWIAQLDAFLRGEEHAGLFTGRALGGRHPELAVALEAGLITLDRHGVIIPALPPAESQRTERLEAIARLYTMGIPITWEQLEPPARFVRLPAYAWQRESFWWDGGTAGAPSLPRPQPQPEHAPAAGPEPPSQLAGLRTLSMAERRARLVPYMQERLGAVLQVEPDQLDPERPLDALGIDSMMAIELKLDVEKDLGIVLPVTSLLVGPTLDELAGEIAELCGYPEIQEGEAPSEPTVVQSRCAGARAPEICEDHPLSHGQQSLWMLHQLAPESPAYHMAGAARVAGELDSTVLARAFQVLCDRHAALRTTFPAEGGRPVQRVHDAGSIAVDFRVEDGLPWDEAERTRRFVAEARRPFDLEQGPLFRARLYTGPSGEHILLLVFHHIVGDFWSIALVLDELGRLYPALRSGRRGELELPPLALTAANFARRQAAELAGEEGARLWAYWRQQLAASLPVLDFPTDRPRPAVQTDRGAQRALVIERALTDRLAALSRAQGASLYTTLLAALQVLLHRYTGQDDVIVGSPVAGRNQPGSAGVVGYFVNTLPMRSDLSGNPGFTTFLGRVRQTVHAALEHQGFPFPLMVERLSLPRDPSRSPVFQVVFVFQKAQGRAAQELTALTLPDAAARVDLGGLALELLPLDLGVAQFDLTLVAAEQNERLALGLEYNTDLFDADTIDRFLAHYRTLLEAIVADPEQPIDALDLLPAAERARLLADGTGMSVAAGDARAATAHQVFENQVRRTPDAPAVVCGPERLSYAGLDVRANHLAEHLRSIGVGPEVRVGLCAERSIALCAGILGILKAGGAYVPLDPDYPEERLDFMIEDGRIDVLVTQEALRDRFAGRVGQIVCIDSPNPLPLGEAASLGCAGGARRPSEGQCATERPGHKDGPTADHLAYVIYTSGSTGKPKGVAVTHANLVHSTEARRLFYDEPVSAFLLLSSFAFDSSIAGIFGTLCHGGTLVLPPPGLQNDPSGLAALIAAQRVSHLLCVPALYELLLAEAPAASLQGVRVAIVAGEACRSSLGARHRAALPRAQLVNEYGPTEATVWCTAHRCWTISTEDEEAGAGGEVLEPDVRAIVPIGRPIPAARIYVLGAGGALAPLGVPGELFVGGAGVARGYLGRPGLTAERFLPDPFASEHEPGSRLYRTGDRARWRPDGSLEFLGRIDDQVKVRGFRIELGEVEAVLAQHPAVREVAVVPREEPGRAVRLVAYMALAAGAPERERGAAASDEWRRWLRERLPESMVPAAFVVMDALPHSPNGKVDRKALPAPDPAQLVARAEYVAPRNPVEALLERVAADVLRCDRVGVNDNVFDLGVDSILSIQIAARARQAGLEFSPALLFQYPTIAEIAAHALGAGGLLVSGEAAMAATGPLPLTPFQRAFFEHGLSDPQHAVEALWLEVPPAPDPAVLARAVRHLVAHHDALRLLFARTETGWSEARVAEMAPDCFTAFDLRALGAADQGPLLDALAAGLLRSLDIEQGPIVRAALFDLGPAQPGRLLLVVHRLAVDRVSWRILLEDLVALERALACGETPVLPATTISYRRWAHRLVHETDPAAREDSAADWPPTGHLPFGPLPLDFDGDRDPGTVSKADTVIVTLDANESRALLEDVPLAYASELTDALLTALTEALARWTDQDAVLIELEEDGRDGQIDLARTVGCFTTRIPVVLELPADPGPAAAFKSIKEQLRTIPRQGIGSDRLRALPRPEVRFALAGESPQPLRSGVPRRSYLLEVDANVTAGVVSVRWNYSAARFRRGTIEALAQEFLAALRALAAHCQSPAARGYTPSDFPLAGLDQRALDQLVLMVEDGAEEGPD
jgi:amino acid adenylation domain-containing protein